MIGGQLELVLPDPVIHELERILGGKLGFDASRRRLSGDRRHLLPLGAHAGIRIVTPQAPLAELRA